MPKAVRVTLASNSALPAPMACAAKIEAAISEFVHNKTLIVIAHRLSSIINADQICVLKAGEIIGCGVHEELLENNECYRTLWEAHQKSQGWQLGKGGIL
jgi:ATP-binding cassette subfamily B protein